ncbi:hypothetical protein ASPZODRAFT_61806 [Penicilliopsis zonata CBS 506.65]|uniref:Peptidase M20 dimerisation domain-containing protein n=1 Tax=Penicilliopsis zonata CBS 506.65 TaxID=1073090 RepID=A0A1L9SNM4_9EURO|nr:hypothetical protein ASPZODRAFT_61806 [Penicilliopsis zonata CBS 506.65]OJJ48726.1 hypothetical protein ASPZODRAFT_61806 [Penicilliopsis zonata CBS 506.65]
MTPSEILATSPLDLAPYEDLYRHFHAHPDLSKQEKATSETAAGHLARLDAFEIHTHIGGYGFVGILRNGPGKTVLLRADMDALPVQEVTGLPYASKTTQERGIGSGDVKPVMHACGHDMHITCLLAAAETLVRLRHAWSGTLLVLFQPDEERGEGAQAMVDDGLYGKHNIPVPDYAFGQHVMRLRAGTVGIRPGTIMAAADSMKIKLYGRGGHGSLPHQTVDPVLLAANVVTRLQGIVSREVNPSESAVVTVGSLHAGEAENVIPDEAELGIDFRSGNLETRQQILSAIERVVEAECVASGSPRKPLFTHTRRFPPTINDTSVTAKLAVSFHEHFKDHFDPDTPRTNVAEDFSTLATCQARPSAFWFFGGIDTAQWDEAVRTDSLDEIPGNHSARFAPAIQPTMRTGVDALCIAALTFLTGGE